MAHDETLSQQLDRTLIHGLDFASREVKHWIIDAIACDLHNEGHSLDGNTAVADVRWLAQMMWGEDHKMSHINAWENLSDQERAVWIRNAELAIKSLPALMGRIAHRAVRMSQALRGIERTIRLNKEVHEENETIAYQRKVIEELRVKVKAGV